MSIQPEYKFALGDAFAPGPGPSSLQVPIGRWHLEARRGNIHSSHMQQLEAAESLPLAASPSMSPVAAPGVTFPPKRGPAADTTVTVGTREWQAGTTIPPLLSGPHKILQTERPLPQWAPSGRGYFYSGFPNSRIVDCGGK